MATTGGGGAPPEYPRPMPNKAIRVSGPLARHIIEVTIGAETYVRPVQLGGFPWGCYHNHCSTPGDCVMFGCIKGHGTPPRSPRSPEEAGLAKRTMKQP